MPAADFPHWGDITGSETFFAYNECGIRPALAELVHPDLKTNSAGLALRRGDKIVAIALGATAGSIALVGFGVDSIIEVSSGFVSLWRLRADASHHRRERVERVAARIAGSLLIALALYIGVGSTAIRTRRLCSMPVSGV
jgi:hypothetical protein